MLVVDDIFDSGSTLKRVCEMLRSRPAHIRTATLYLKEGANLTDLEPDYFLRKTDKWIVFPHELMDLSLDEIKQKDEYIHQLLS